MEYKVKNRLTHLIVETPTDKFLIPKDELELKIQYADNSVSLVARMETIDLPLEKTVHPLADNVDELFSKITNMVNNYGHNNIFRFLDTNGDGSGIKNANGDYSSTPTSFKIQPPAGQVFGIERMIAQISGNGLDTGAYGNNLTLSNGIYVRVMKEGQELIELTDNIPIMTNQDWSRYAYDVDYKDYGQGQQYVTVRWTFSRTGQKIWLDGNENEYLEVLLNDDFSSMSLHYFQIQGLYES